jgi:threonine synthase
MSVATAAPALIVRCDGCAGPADPLAGRCEMCGSPASPVYPRGALAVRDGVTGDSLKRYRATLPVADPALYRLPVARTPLVELAPLAGRRVFGKVEGALPTGSTKDRLVAVALPYLLERGVRRFAFSSTGNTAVAYAHGLHVYPELEARVYVSPRVDRSTLAPIPSNLGVAVVNGDYALASARARAEGTRSGFVPEGGFFNIGRREGAKLAYREALEDLAHEGVEVGAIVQAVASGLGIYAAARAIEELRAAGTIHTRPRLFCAQQASCAPMVAAYRAGDRTPPERHVVRDPTGIAPALLLGDPFGSYASVAREVRRSGGDFVAVPDGEVAQVLRDRRAGAPPVGASAAVALAASRRVAPTLASGESLLVLLTGGPGR